MAAAEGEKWLVVLDDCWQVDHLEVLTIFTDGTESHESRIFVTSRFAHLLAGSRQINIGLLSEEDGLRLLWATAGVTQTPKREGVMRELLNLCGHLPLFVGMIGRQIAEYGSDCLWETEVLSMLQDDRSSVFNALGGKCTRNVYLHYQL